MTKSVLFAALALTLLALAPLATAHGAAEARTIDTRLLADDDGFFAYDAGAQAGLAASGGHDLLSLDIREASDALGAPVVWFRLTWQTDATEPVTDILRLSAGGQQYEFELSSSITGITGHTFDAATGPFDVGDGHPKAFDLMVRYGTLGVQPGDELTGIELVGQAADGSTADVAPGTWMTNLGELAPYGGDPTTSAEAGSHVLQGPADLLRAAGDAAFEADVGAPIEAQFDLTNPTEIDQFVFIGGASDSLQLNHAAGLTIAAGEIRTVNITLTPLVAGELNGTIALFSDLGGYAEIPVTVAAHGAEHEHAPPASEDPVDDEQHRHAEDGEDAEHDHSDHDHDATDAADLAQESPGVGFALLAVGLVAIAIVRRK